MRAKRSCPARLPSIACSRGLDARELVEVGAAAEASGLARDDEGREAALLELGQKPGERFERAAAEDVRPAGARPVIHRHERHRVDAVQVELGHRLAHGSRLSSRCMPDWDEHLAREVARYEDGEARLPDDPDARQRQLTRMGNAAGGAGLALLMAGRGDEASDWLHRAAERYRESIDDAPPGSWGRPIGAMKALVLAGDWPQAEEAARWALELGAAESESPIGRYAAALALLVLGRDHDAVVHADAIRTSDDFPHDVGRRARVRSPPETSSATSYAVESVLDSFETREEYLEDIPVADTVLVLQALAARRGLASELSSPLLPATSADA